MLRVVDVGFGALTDLLDRFELRLQCVPENEEIKASFWGDSEAGIVGHTVFVRNDTPVHSFLHETCHLICMSRKRRLSVDTNAGGNDLEESAVCYLQVVLADYVVGVSRTRIVRDMDEWGYSFRLGSTLAWFQSDAADAQEFLRNHGLLTPDNTPSFRMRD